MADDGDRAKVFPAIERKHGTPIAQWIDRLRDLGDAKYPEQVAFLREQHGFSQAHANALVMYVRGSTSARRFRSPDQWFAAQDPAAAHTARAILHTVRSAHPGLELVLAWNHPMLRTEDAYVLGVSAARGHVLVNPFSGEVLAACADRLAGYVVNKKTFAVPIDWEVDADLLGAIVAARLAEVS